MCDVWWNPLLLIGDRIVSMMGKFDIIEEKMKVVESVVIEST